MPLPDMLLHIDTWPDPTPDPAIEQAIGFTRLIGGKLTALAVEVEIPLHSNRAADHLLGLGGLAREEEARSHRAMESSLGYFSSLARPAGVFAGVSCAKADIYETPQTVAHCAIARDVCLVPITDRFNDPVGVAQSILFDAGCPVIIFRHQEAKLPLSSSSR